MSEKTNNELVGQKRALYINIQMINSLDLGLGVQNKHIFMFWTFVLEVSKMLICFSWSSTKLSYEHARLRGPDIHRQLIPALK